MARAMMPVSMFSGDETQWWGSCSFLFLLFVLVDELHLSEWFN